MVQGESTGNFLSEKVGPNPVPNRVKIGVKLLLGPWGVPGPSWAPKNLQKISFWGPIWGPSWGHVGGKFIFWRS
mgnify:CR=1 FL=1